MLDVYQTEKGFQNIVLIFIKSTSITNLCFLIIGEGLKNFVKKNSKYTIIKHLVIKSTGNYLSSFVRHWKELSKMYKMIGYIFYWTLNLRRGSLEQ